jgi:WD40 repeat protein
VTHITVDTHEQLLLSCSFDSFFHVRRLSDQTLIEQCSLQAGITCLKFDPELKIFFLGTVEGDIAILKYEGSKSPNFHKYKGHAGSTTCLEWDGEKQRLFSGGEDHRIVIWNFKDELIF